MTPPDQPSAIINPAQLTSATGGLDWPDWPVTPPAEPPLAGWGSVNGGPSNGSPLAGWGNRAGGGPPASPPPRGGGRRGILVTAAVVLAVALLAVTFVAGTRLNRSDQVADTAPTTTTFPKSSIPKRTTPTTQDPGTQSPSGGLFDPSNPTDPTNPGSGTTGGTIDPQQLDVTVKTIEAFIEKDRGHTFKNPVTVQVLAHAEFQQKVLEGFAAGEDAMRKQGDLLKAFGLIPADLDVVATQKQLLGSGVLGFYDPESKELYVGGDHIGPFLREVIAHELTHALDDQYFNLNRPDIDKATDGSQWAFLALVEGSAKRVENDYVAQLSSADKATLQEEQLALGADQMGALMSLPMVLAQIQMMPYDYGEPFVRGIVQRHGLKGLDDAFAALPTTSEQVLDGSKYDNHEPAVAVGTPKADGTATDDGVIGELMTGLILHGGGDATDGGSGLGIDPQQLQDLLGKIMNGEIDPSDLDKLLGELGGSGAAGGSTFGVVQTVKGWGGDHYVVWTSPAQGVCVRADWKMDTPTALAAMLGALRTWAAADQSHPTVAQPTPDAVEVTRCSGGGGATTPTTPPTTTPPTTTPPTTAPRTPTTSGVAA